MRLIAIALLAVLLAGCDETLTTGRSTAPRTPVQLSGTDIKAVETAVAREMRDPESARFDGIRAGKTPSGELVVCGWVNARNGFGGYAGREPFAGYLKGGEFSVVAISPSIEAKWIVRAEVSDLCGAFGDYYDHPYFRGRA
jgi:hypothetical protein